jgi:pimeloyl-ACP methyl ester carboxylesterase
MEGRLRPLVLIRGYGGPDISGERSSPYQGFNDGTVYPGKRGENYIYEGFLLRALKSSRFPYTDATNVIGYYAKEVDSLEDVDFPQEMTSGSVVIDPATARQVLRSGVAGTIWIYRYYDLSPRSMERYGAGLVRLVTLLAQAARSRGEPFRGVDVVAHSMGGLVVREALRQLHTSPAAAGRHGDGAEDKPACRYVHKIVTLGTPHRGIAFQRIPRWLLDMLPDLDRGAKELAAFDPSKADSLQVREWFEIDRILTVVGTNYRT